MPENFFRPDLPKGLAPGFEEETSAIVPSTTLSETTNIFRPDQAPGMGGGFEENVVAVISNPNPARSTLLVLVSQVRRLIGDTDTLCKTFTDEDIQDVLDANRTDIRYARLYDLETIAPGGQRQYLSYRADRTDWEATEIIQDGSFNVLTPYVADRRRGVWTFEAQPKRPLYLTGSCYDIFASAAELAENWSAKLGNVFDFAPGSGQSYKVSQKRDAKDKLALSLWRKARPRMATQSRSDVAESDLLSSNRTSY